MKKLLVLFLLLPRIAWGQSGVCKGSTSATGTPLTCTFNQSVGVGTVLLVGVVLNLSDQAHVILSVTDSTGLNNYGAPLVDTQKTAPSVIRTVIFGTTLAGAVTAGSTVLTVSINVLSGQSAGSIKAVDVEAYPGATLTTDGTATWHGQSVSLQVPGPTPGPSGLPTTNANDLLVAAFGVYGSPGIDDGTVNPIVFTPETNWSLGGEFNAGVISNDRSIMFETFSPGATGTFTATGGLTGSGNVPISPRVYAAGLIALQQTASTPTPTITQTPTITPTSSPSPTPTCAPACCDNIAGSPQCQAMVGCSCPGGYTQHTGESCP